MLLDGPMQRYVEELECRRLKVDTLNVQYFERRQPGRGSLIQWSATSLCICFTFFLEVVGRR